LKTRLRQKKPREEAAKAAAEVKRKNDKDKLFTLEKLILAQKEEKLRREQAIEAALVSERASSDARAVTGVAIRFEDAIGRKFSCPWQHCNTWKVSRISLLSRCLD
jgi:hypothetical protein